MVEPMQHDTTLERLSKYDTFSLPVDFILYDETFNCRGPFTLQSVKDLAANIRDNGLTIPIVVQPWEQDGYAYRLLAGHRRFVAVTQVLEWPSIPASVRHGLTESQARLLNFTENLERKDLNPLEEALALRALWPNGVTLNEAAKVLKRPTAWVCDRKRLLTLPEEVQQFAAAGLIAMCSIKVLVALPPDQQLVAARKIVEAKRQHGKYASLMHLDARFRRKFRSRRTKAEIGRMVAKMLHRGITGLGPRMGAWCAGEITNAAIEQDIKQAAKGEPDSTESL